MGRLEAAKRTIILQLSLVGLVFQTAVYIYVWQHVYNEIMQQGMWRSFHEKGFYLLAAVYFLLILFFTGTYGGLKIGYLKPMDVFFFTGAFSCICQCNILFSDFLVIIGAGNAISTVSYDAGANWDISCMDIYQQSAVSTVFSAQKAAVDQRLPLD